MSSIPQIVQLAAVSGLEAACNRVIGMDDTIGHKLAPLTGKVIQVHLIGPNADLYFLPQDNFLALQASYEGEATTKVEGKPSDFIELMMAEDAGSTLINGDIKINGETASLITLQEAFKNSDLDWEYELSKVVGDIAAHEIGKAARAAAGWLKKARPKAEERLEKIINEEAKLVPSKAEIKAFCDGVDDLANRTERLEALINRKLNS